MAIVFPCIVENTHVTWKTMAHCEGFSTPTARLVLVCICRCSFVLACIAYVFFVFASIACIGSINGIYGMYMVWQYMPIHFLLHWHVLWYLLWYLFSLYLHASIYIIHTQYQHNRCQHPLVCIGTDWQYMLVYFLHIGIHCGIYCGIYCGMCSVCICTNHDIIHAQYQHNRCQCILVCIGTYCRQVTNNTCGTLPLYWYVLWCVLWCVL